MERIKQEPLQLTTGGKMPSPKYFLYILQLNDSGHFYIGVTCNCKKREEQHFISIHSIVSGLKSHEAIHLRKKVKPEFDPQIGQKVHLFFANKIKPLVDCYLFAKRTIQWHYSFSVKYSCYTQEEIKYIENVFLNKFKGNKKCLNVQYTSRYIHK